MEHLGNFPFPGESNPAPGHILIPEQQEQLRLPPWNGNPMEQESLVATGHGTCCPPCRGQNSSSGKPGRAWQLRSCGQADTERPSSSSDPGWRYSMLSLPVFHGSRTQAGITEGLESQLEKEAGCH